MTNNEISIVKELTVYLKIAEKKAYSFASERRLAGFKLGGVWRFRKSETDQWIDEQSKREDK